MKYQLVRFGSVGVIVTATDFAFLNLLLLAHLPLFAANLISVSVSMLLSYYMNKRHVFGRQATNVQQKLLFAGGTMFAVYILQTIVIIAVSYHRGAIEHALNPLTFGVLTTSFLFTNVAKMVATVVSTVWNYLFYKYIVFRPQSQ